MQNAASTEALHVNVKSFNLTKAITDKNLFSKVDLTPVARLIIFNLSNMYNPRLGYSFPGIQKLINCTGYQERQLKSGLKELSNTSLIVRTDKKIYFTKKFYELLGMIEEKNFCDQDANISQESANITSESANFAPTCHEQNKKQIKKHFVKNSFSENEEYQVKKLLEKDSYLSNKQKAEIVLNGFHQYNTKETDYKAILQIKEIWNFKPESFDILRYFEQRKRTDMIFKRKIENLELEISEIFHNYSKQIEELRQSWQ